MSCKDYESVPNVSQNDIAEHISSHSQIIYENLSFQNNFQVDTIFQTVLVLDGFLLVFKELFCIRRIFRDRAYALMGVSPGPKPWMWIPRVSSNRALAAMGLSQGPKPWMWTPRTSRDRA